MDDALIKTIGSVFEGLDIESPEEHRLAIICKPDAVLGVLSFLRDGGHNHLALVSCVDWIDEKKLELVYVLSRYLLDDDGSAGDRERMTILVKTRISRDKPLFLSAIPLFPNAEPYEREIHELFGVHFGGHPRLTPLFLERAYEIPPFRKDFDTRKYVQDLFDKIPFVDKEAEGT